MRLQPGTRLGPYEIVAAIGAGGMGEVYRARDTRLDRDVALKTLPAAVTLDAAQRARFDREARTLSALSHPHICPLYDVGVVTMPPDDDPVAYFVMELLTGETLAERLQRGRLPPGDVLRLAAQLADAIAAAHRHGLVHRDLKPGNVMVGSSGVRLFDFGLAKDSVPAAWQDEAETATTPPPVTEAGLAVGTLPYMAPEQVEGRGVDARTDIWALGCVIFEMATGRRAFVADTPAGTIGAILRDEPPPVSSLEPAAPPGLDHLVATCLAKAPDDRYQAAHDVAIHLRSLIAAGSAADIPATSPRSHRSILAWAAAAAAMAALITAFAMRGSPDETGPEIAFKLEFPSDTYDIAGRPPAVSHDGQSVVFQMGSSSDEGGGLWLRRLSDSSTRLLPGTRGALAPFWSPDDRHVAFLSGRPDERELRRLDLSTGTIRTVTAIPGGNGGTWNQHDEILLSSRDGLFLTAAASGPARALDRRPNVETPLFLPDGRHFLYCLLEANSQVAVMLASLDDPVPIRLTDASYAQVRFVDPGYVLFARDTTVFAQPLDLEQRRLTGSPFALVDDVGPGNRRALFDASATGMFAYRSYTDRQAPMVPSWYAPGPQRPPEPALPAGAYSMMALSPDGTRLAIGREASPGDGNIWIFDLATGLPAPLTTGPGNDAAPVWSPDGAWIVFQRQEAAGGAADLFIRSTADPSAERVLLGGDAAKTPTDWSRDGRYLIYTSRDEGILALPMRDGAPDGDPEVVVSWPEGVGAGHVDPSGRWMAFRRLLDGRPQLAVTAFPSGGPVHPLSADLWQWPVWSADGRQIYAQDGAFRLLALPVAISGDGVRPVGPAALIAEPDPPRPKPQRNYYTGPGPDGRFLLPALPTGDEMRTFTLLVNWQSRLRR
ncbi:MAG TPA: protein kinase [Vicinamibacterales bacterium]|nr:protein kinase [Vicinamibacterales bacterium]